MKKSILILIFVAFQSGFAQWESCSNGLIDGNISCITFNDNKIFAGSWGVGVFVSTDDGAYWTLVNNGLEDLEVYSLAMDGNTLYAGTANFIYYSTDFGVSWKQLNSKITKLETYNIGFNSNKMFVCTSHGLLISGDKFDKDISMAQGLMNNGNLYGLAFNGDNVFVSHESKGIYMSNDNGLNWINIAKGTFLCVKIRDNKIYLGGYGGIYTSEDNGSTWKNINKGLEKTIVYDIAFDEYNIFCSTGKQGDGIFISSDNGINWSSVNDGLVSKEVHSLKIKNELIFACTRKGIFKAKLSDFGITGMEAITQEHLIPFPNPAGDFITIQPSEGFEPSEGSKVQIFNTLGILVAQTPPTVISGQTKASDLLRIDISNLPTGVYFIKIGDRVEKFVKR